MILPLKIKNSQILPSSFSISRVLYGVDRKDDFDIEKNTRNKSVLLNINEIIETDFFDKNENSNARKNESDYNENESVNDYNDEIEKNLGSNPAKNSAELTLRIENIINNKMKLKKQKHPEPFSIKMKKNNDSESKKSEIIKSPIFTDNDDEIDNIGIDYQNNLPDDGEGFIEGYSSVILDVLCAPLVIGKYYTLLHRTWVLWYIVVCCFVRCCVVLYCIVLYCVVFPLKFRLISMLFFSSFLYHYYCYQYHSSLSLSFIF